MKLRILPEAREELRSAITYYERERAGVGRRFLLHVRKMLQEIRSLPERFACRRARRVKEELRSVVLSRFPYEIIFDTEQKEVVVVAVAHAKRRPGYWCKRLDRK